MDDVTARRFVLKSHWKSLRHYVRERAKFLLRADCLLCGTDIAEQYSLPQKTAYVIDLCDVCTMQFKRNLRCCERCALPLNEALHELNLESCLCGSCQHHSPPWQKAIASFLYVYPLDRLLISLKYKGRVDISRCLARLMIKDLTISYAFNDRHTGYSPPDCLVPVPLHPLREFQRGYNQAALLAKEIGLQLEIPLRLDLLRRDRHTPKQSRLSKAQRERNLQTAFRVNSKSSIPDYVVIVDDVMTTGSTAEAATKALIKAGVKRVDVWCCARSE